MGDYSVPDYIRKFKPKGTMVKKVHGHYYVYQYFNRKNDDGKWRIVMGKMIGHIDESLGFVPNDNYVITDKITTLNYGQYAFALNGSKEVLDRLLRFFNPVDAHRIYLLALIHFVHGYSYLKNIKPIYDQSYFSLIYPNLSFGYESLTQLLDDLGRKQTRSLQFEQSLIDDSSKEIAIDGHVISCSSHENELAENGYKFSLLQDSQINVLMGYDINTNCPLFSRIYDGANLDKVSVQDTLKRHELHDILFVVDRGFYSEKNIELFSSNNNQYIIPLSPNLKIYKKAIEDMRLDQEFVYEKNRKNSVISYKQVKVNNKRVIVYKDLSLAAIEKVKYLKNIETDNKKYTEDRYEKIKDFFGVIVLETNIENTSAKEIYEKYKSRWKIETYYNYLKNNAHYESLSQNDYYKTEGLSFIMLVSGLIHSSVNKLVKENIKGKSIDDCLLEAAFMKIHLLNGKWGIENIKSKTKQMMENVVRIDFDKEYELINTSIPK